MKPSIVQGRLLGGALGDALGYPVEFESDAAAIAARLPALRPRLVSDDTQMTLFTVEAIVRARGAGRLGLERAACEPGHDELHDVVQRALATADAGRIDPIALERLGGGWVGEEALAIALACALHVAQGTPQLVALALSHSVTHAGDSDSTGSLTGNLLGCLVRP